MIKGKKIYLIGIGGISMSGVALILKEQGSKIFGSDIKESLTTKRLEKQGIEVAIGHQREHIKKDLDLVVKTDAIPDSNPELKEAQKLGIPVWSRTKTIQEIVKDRKLIAVAGTHGKSTVSAMIAYILTKANKDPIAFLGAESEQIKGTSRNGQGEWAVAEACEYRGAFWEFKPQIAVITNIDSEHLDFYHSLAGVKKGFLKFIDRLKKDGLLLIYSGSQAAIEVARKSGREFQTYGDQLPKDLKLKLFGRYNLVNAVAALAIAERVGVDRQKATNILESFQGIRRRSEYLGERDNIILYDDYAHHPTEIRVTLAAFKERFPDKRLIVVYQPHLGQRLSSLFNQFVDSLKIADQIVVVKVYQPPGRAEKAKKDSQDLAERLGSIASYADNYQKALVQVKEQVKRGDLLITMGAGPIDRVAKAYLKD